MPFEFFSPDKMLKPYIQCYWTLTGNDTTFDTLHPDGCVDVIANLGEDFLSKQKNILLKKNGVYLGGALTEAVCEKVPVGIFILGVRLVPGCFGCFYPPKILSKVRNDCVRVEDAYLPPLQALKNDPIPALNTFFQRRLYTSYNPLQNAVAIIANCAGNITLTEIAADCNKSKRQTERIFNQMIGLSPKQFCKVLQYAHVQKLLANRPDNETLLSVAIDAGYYDHAHLTKSFKKIALRTPGEK
ncbi:MAG TPA: AraC family transcriptional regulator [Niabella sp.]|nr:AraC family transcriptional regulator [Niabella sp.]